MFQNIFLFTVLLTALTSPVKGNECAAYGRNPASCVNTPSCTFCIKEGFAFNRCDYVENLIGNGCGATEICDPNGNTEIIVEPSDEESCGPPPAPILPVCPGMKRNVSVTFQISAHPVDVYLLMDFSGSMGDDKANVVALSAQLVSAVQDMSPDHTLGFGAFVDKPIMPFGDSYYEDYSFHNVLPLTDQIEDFADYVQATPMAGGADGPEGQLEGMFQSAACKSQIGWRNNSRHMLLVATDATYHISGEGATVGITAPFDGSCALDGMGFYENELTQDYPSENQIVEIMENEQMTVIFAVTSNVVGHYQLLADRINPSAVGVLAHDSSNVVDLIIDEYNRIASRVEIEQSEITDDIHINYYSNCNGDGVEETTICENIKNGTVTFTVEIDLLECPIDDSYWSQSVKINPKGLPTFAEIAIQLICNGEW